MNVIVNPMLPLYVDDSTGSIRLGGLPKTGKIITSELRELSVLLRMCANESRTIEQVEELLWSKSGMDSFQVRELIRQLLDEGILVPYSHVELFNTNPKLSRQAMFFSMFTDAERGVCLNERLANCTVAVLGLGAIGTAVAAQLARAGLGELRVVDGDRVDPSNLQRQTLYFSNDIGALKVIAAKNRLQQINPALKVVAVDKYVRTSSEILDIITGVDFVVSTLDEPHREIRRFVNAACISLNTPCLYAGFSEYLALVGPLVVPHVTACWRCEELALEPQLGSEYVNTERVVPSFGPLCGLVGDFASAEVIKWLTEFAPVRTLSRTLMFDFIEYSIRTEQWERRQDCPVFNGGGLPVETSHN